MMIISSDAFEIFVVFNNWFLEEYKYDSICKCCGNKHDQTNHVIGYNQR